MISLNLPRVAFRIKNKENKLYIFDEVRKKNVVLTDEEWVRQHFLQFLIRQMKYPPSLIAVEKQCKVNSLTKRTDILVFNTQGSPFIIVECKAPNVAISQETFDQIARYNMELRAPFLVVTNGLKHYYCRMDHKRERYEFLKEIPSYIQKSDEI